MPIDFDNDEEVLALLREIFGATMIEEVSVIGSPKDIYDFLTEIKAEHEAAMAEIADTHPYAVMCTNGCCTLSRHKTLDEAYEVCPPGNNIIGPSQEISN